MKKILLLISFCIATTFAKAQTVYVNATAGGNNDGTTWFDAYTDLQTAITNTSSGEIWVATGVYYPGSSGTNAATFTLKNNVGIYGGFIGNETVIGDRDPMANTTTLSGDLDQSGTKNSNDAYHVVSSGETNSSAILDGFTITGGNATGGGINSVGGGMLCDGNASVSVNPTVVNCTFSDNSAAGNGGGVFIICDQTGGHSTAPKFLICKFYGNNSLSFGGGAYIYATGSLTFCTPFFESCLFYNNVASASASCLYAENNNTGEVHVTVTNCTFYGNNTGTEIQYQAYGINGTFQIDNSIFYGLDLSTDDVFLGDHNDGPMGLFPSNVGSIDADPQFANPGAYDFGFGCSSPCWDMGNNASITYSFCLDNGMRTVGPFVDMGAVEVPFVAPTVVANGPAAVCNGTPVTLNGSGAFTYAWSGGVFDNVSFTPGFTTTYTLTGTDAGGCQATDTITVIVNPLPTVGADCTDPDRVVCEGDVVSFFGTGTGGVIYSWDNGVIDNGAYATTASATFFTVIGTDVNGCSATDFISLSIESMSGVNAGVDQHLCNTGSAVVNLNANPDIFVTYGWTTAGTGIFDFPASVTPIYTPSPGDLAASPIALVFQVSPSICPTYNDTVWVYVETLPTATAPPDVTVCQGDAVSLSGGLSGTPPFIYNWSNGGTLSTAQTGDSYVPTVTENVVFTVMDLYGCSASDTFLVTLDASQALLGTIHVGAGALTDGVLLLLQYDTQQMAFDTLYGLPFSSGTGSYNIPGLPHGDYLIKIIPDTSLFPNLLPTYYGDAFQWDSATVINHNCVSDFTADINMIQLLGGTGTGTVSGFIIEGAGFGARMGISHDHVFAPGGPLKGVDVKLGKNPGGGIQARTMSDTSGYYEFTNLPDDTFRIYVDIPGLPMDSFYIVTVTANTTTNQNYYADSNSVFPALTGVGIHQYTDEVSSVSLYPNPAASYTSIVFESEKQNTASIRLIDITGKQLMNIQIRNLPKGKHEYQLNFADQHLKSGIYFIELVNEKGKTVKKLVIE